MESEDIKFLINQKMRRLESLRSKGFLSSTIGDSIEEDKLNEEIKELEEKLNH